MAGRYFSYEAGYLLEPKLVPLLRPDDAPLLCLGVFDAPVEEAVPPRSAATPNGPIFDARAAWSFEDYEKRFSRLHQHIRQGDCYQGNLTFPIHAQWSGDPLAAFDALTERQPVKYGALIALGDPIVLSRSPELFFEIDASGMIETHPMKGTAPRGATKVEDERQKIFLRNDEKNQAENRMIVDLLRNDISLISEVGTLEVPALFRIETYPTVHQMVSDVRAKLLPGLGIRRSSRRYFRAARSPARQKFVPWKSCTIWKHAARRLLRRHRLDRARRHDALFRGDPHHLALFRRRGRLQYRRRSRLRFDG